jgi:DNA replication protein DnaC
LEKALETLDLKRLPPKAAQQIRSLLEGGFVGRHENVLIFGNHGSGKTHAACALGQELIRSGTKVTFASCDLMVQDLLAAKKELKLRSFLKKISRYEVLILDDIGYVQYSREEMEVLFVLLAERYERGSVILTSNLPFSGWESIFKDPMTTAAAIDRLVHHSVILELNVASYRAEQAKKSLQSAPESKIPSKEAWLKTIDRDHGEAEEPRGDQAEGSCTLSLENRILIVVSSGKQLSPIRRDRRGQDDVPGLVES